MFYIFINYMHYQGSFRQLIAWQKAKELTLWIYEITKKFPKEEIYALSSQVKRASYSVMANIAEGNNRKHRKEKIQFFYIALSSLTEVDCFIELSFELKYITQEELEEGLELINKTGFLLRKLISAVESQSS